MPALRVFGRRWLIAEDDCPAPALFMLLYHIIWIIPIICWYYYTPRTLECQERRQYTGAVSGLLLFFILSAVAEALIIFVGMRGTMFERSKRKHLPALVYGECLSHLGQLAVTVYLTWEISYYPMNCSIELGAWDPDAFLWAIMVVTWIYLLIVLLFIFIVYNPRSDYDKPASWEGRYNFILWMAACCCCWNPMDRAARARQQDRARRVGANLCSMFGHVDLTVTDALAAFALARNMFVQEEKEKKKAVADADEVMAAQEAQDAADDDQLLHAAMDAQVKGEIEESPSEQVNSTQKTAPTQEITAVSKSSGVLDPLNAPTPERQMTRRGIEAAKHVPGIRTPMEPSLRGPAIGVDVSILEEAEHFFKYAFATYGWMLYIFNYGVTAAATRLCCGCGTRGNYGMLGPCLSGKINHEVALNIMDAPPCDLLFLREEGALIDVLSYLIAVDHDKKSIVVAVRGALSISDNVRDLLFEAGDLDEWMQAATSWVVRPPEIKPPTPTSTYLAQANYLDAARATLTDILDQGVLHDALVGADAKYAGYDLVVTGHSLGAAAAYFISLYLRQLIPDLHCWAFSPPQGLASANLGEDSASWCTTVVCGKELPPRYSVTTLDRARDELILAAARSRRSKIYILLRWIWGGDIPTENFMLPDSAETPLEIHTMLDTYFASLEADKHRQWLLETAGTFGLPGAVIYLQPTRRVISPAGGCLCCAAEPVRDYRAVWVQARAMADEGLLLSGRVLADHMPDYQLGVLDRLVEKVKKEEMKGAQR